MARNIMSYRNIVSSLLNLCIDDESTMSVWQYLATKSKANQDTKVAFLRGLGDMPEALIDLLSNGKPTEVALLIESYWDRLTPEIQKRVRSRRVRSITVALAELKELAEYPETVEELTEVADLRTRMVIASRTDIARAMRIKALKGNPTKESGPQVIALSHDADKILDGLVVDQAELLELADSTSANVVLWVAKAPGLDTETLRALLLRVAWMYDKHASKPLPYPARSCMQGALNALLDRRDLTAATQTQLSKATAVSRGGYRAYNAAAEKVVEVLLATAEIAKVKPGSNSATWRRKTLWSGSIEDILIAINRCGKLSETEVRNLATRWREESPRHFRQRDTVMLVSTLEKSGYTTLARTAADIGLESLADHWRDFLDPNDAKDTESILAVIPISWFVRTGMGDSDLSRLWVEQLKKIGCPVDTGLELVSQLDSGSLGSLIAVLS